MNATPTTPCARGMAAPEDARQAGGLGGGPPYFRDGRHPVYPVTGLDKFAIARLGEAEELP